MERSRFLVVSAMVMMIIKLWFVKAKKEEMKKEMKEMKKKNGVGMCFFPVSSNQKFCPDCQFQG